MNTDDLKRLATELKKTGKVNEAGFYGSRQTGMRHDGGSPPSDNADWDMYLVTTQRLSDDILNQAKLKLGLGVEDIHIKQVFPDEMREHRLGGMEKFNPIFEAMSKGTRL